MADGSSGITHALASSVCSSCRVRSAAPLMGGRCGACRASAPRRRYVIKRDVRTGQRWAQEVRRPPPPANKLRAPTHPPPRTFDEAVQELEWWFHDAAYEIGWRSAASVYCDPLYKTDRPDPNAPEPTVRVREWRPAGITSKHVIVSRTRIKIGSYYSNAPARQPATLPVFLIPWTAARRHAAGLSSAVYRALGRLPSAGRHVLSIAFENVRAPESLTRWFGWLTTLAIYWHGVGQYEEAVRECREPDCRSKPPKYPRCPHPRPSPSQWLAALAESGQHVGLFRWMQKPARAMFVGVIRSYLAARRDEYAERHPYHARTLAQRPQRRRAA